MNEAHLAKISHELTLQPQQVAATAELLDDGGTVPFIARYRKEATGSLDEVAITAIRDRLDQLAELDKRREAILKSLDERELLTDELQAQIEAAETMTALEDIYLPYRPKRRTRATIAREKGLEPLADAALRPGGRDRPAGRRRGVRRCRRRASTRPRRRWPARATSSPSGSTRTSRRASRCARSSQQQAAVKSAGRARATRQEAAKFRDYFDWTEPVAKAPSHRMLAMLRGEREGFLLLKLAAARGGGAGAAAAGCSSRADNAAAAQVARGASTTATSGCWRPRWRPRLRLGLKKRADEEAIRVFAENLRELLLAPPLGQQNVLAIDPGFRTGCKLVCLDRQGKLLHNETIYPTQSEKMAAQAADARARPGAEAPDRGHRHRQRHRRPRDRDLRPRARICRASRS